MGQFMVKRRKKFVGALELAQVGHRDPVQARTVSGLGGQSVDDFGLVGHDVEHQLSNL
jgi:hypothetical protein